MQGDYSHCGVPKEGERVNQEKSGTEVSQLLTWRQFWVLRGASPS